MAVTGVLVASPPSASVLVMVVSVPSFFPESPALAPFLPVVPASASAPSVTTVSPCSPFSSSDMRGLVSGCPGELCRADGEMLDDGQPDRAATEQIVRHSRVVRHERFIVGLAGLLDQPVEDGFLLQVSCLTPRHCLKGIGGVLVEWDQSWIGSSPSDLRTTRHCPSSLQRPGPPHP